MAEHKARFITTTVEVEGRTEQRVVELPAFDLAPWDVDAALTHVGARATRVDAAVKATGRPGYTGLLGADQTVTVTQPISALPRFYRLKVRLQ